MIPVPTCTKNENIVVWGVYFRAEDAIIVLDNSEKLIF